MTPRSVSAPTIPIPFHKLLKVVAVVDRGNAQTTQLLDQIAAQGFDIEIADSFDREPVRGRSRGCLHRLDRRRPHRERPAGGANDTCARIPDARSRSTASRDSTTKC